MQKQYSIFEKLCSFINATQTNLTRNYHQFNLHANTSHSGIGALLFKNPNSKYFSQANTFGINIQNLKKNIHNESNIL